MKINFAVRMVLPIIFLGAVALPVSCDQGRIAIAPIPASQRQPRLDIIQAGILKSADDLQRKAATPNFQPSIRDLPNCALAMLLAGQDTAAAEKLLRMAFDQQDMNPASPRYGSLPWQIGHPEIVDENATEFGTQALGPLWRLFGERLSANFKNDMKPHFEAAFAAMRRREFRTPAYTNIFLMRAVNMILMGEAIGDDKAAGDGYDQLDAWIAWTKTNGIHEFDSPTYYGVDLNCLGLGYRFAARPEGKAKFKAILDVFWSDIAANFFAANGTLAGPHSRNYDFLRSSGGLDLYLYAEGLRQTEKIDKLDFEKTFLLTNLVPDGYHPAAPILALANLPERTVRGRWDEATWKDRTNYLTPGFAIGGADGDYNAQDKMISVELASTKDLPVISIVPDTFDAPYGIIKTADKSGHNKPTHLPLSPTVVQDKGALLALLDLDPGKDSKPVTSLATNILLPAKADALVLDGKTLKSDAAFEQSAGLDAIIGVREGKSGVVIRVFHADGCAGQAPVFALKGDAIGLKSGVVRFVAYHYKGAAKALTERHVRVGLLFLAAPCEDEAAFQALLQRASEARIEDKGDERAWQVRARVGELSLEAERNLEKRRPGRRRVNGVDVVSPVLSVNGTDIMAQMPDVPASPVVPVAP